VVSLSPAERQREKPFIVRVFDKHIQNYQLIQGLIIAEPKTPRLIKNLFFRSLPVGILGFGETKWYITAVHEAVDKTRMNKKAAELYRKLKGMECQMEAKGLLRKKITFKPHESLTELKRHIPTLQVSDKLCQALEKNEKILRLIKSINPGEMSIGLHSIPELYQAPKESAASTDRLTQNTVYYFKNPSSITWIITLSTLFHEGPGVQRKADIVIYLFNAIFRTIREMS